MPLKGKTLLKVVSILYIIGAVLMILLGLLTMVGGGAAVAGLAGAGDGAVMSGALIMVLGIAAILGSVFSLVCGIIGVKNCNNPAKAQLCFVLGIILLVFAVISLITTLAGGADASDILTSLAGLVLPILYTLAAYWNKQPVAPVDAPQQ